MNIQNLIVTLKTGVQMAGPGALDWLWEQITYRPEEILPATVDLTNKDEAQAKVSSLQWAAATLGRLGGKSKSPAKQAASRENGRKGGRPIKTGYCAVHQHYGDRYDASFCGPIRATDDEALTDQQSGGYDCTRWVGPDGYLYVDQPDNP